MFRSHWLTDHAPGFRLGEHYSRPNDSAWSESALNRNRAGRGRREHAGEAELGDLAGEAVGLGLWRGSAEVFGAEVLVEGAVSEHVIDRSQDRGRDGADRLLGSAPVAQALELHLEVAGLLAAGGPGTL